MTADRALTWELPDYADLRQIGWADGRPVFLTLAPMRYRSALLGRTVVIPAEFVSDLASVPRVPGAWLVAGGRGPRAALVHDFAYQFGFWILDDGTTLAVDKAMVDAAFREALVADPISGAGGGLAWLMFQAVTYGGRGRWARPERTEALNPVWSADPAWASRVELGEAP